MTDAAPLFENHLHFLNLHRGSLSRDREGIWVKSNAPGFTTWTPTGNSNQLPPGCAAVRLPPGHDPGWEDRLGGQDFSKAETLIYMVLADPHKPVTCELFVEIDEVRTASAARSFADVQSAGFATGDEATDRWWSRYFAGQALQNFEDSDQSFYLARRHEAPAGCALVVRAANVAGIYAVTTRPGHRRQGVGTALLERIRHDALRGGFQDIVLQAMSGSYAADYYSRLGFREVFRGSVWRK